MPPRQLPSVKELRELFEKASSHPEDRPQEGGASGRSDAGPGASGSASPPPSRPQPQHHAIQPQRMHPSPFEQHHNVPQPRVENLSLSRSNSGSRRGTLVGRGSEGAALQAPPLPLQPYGEHVSAQLRRRTLEARALLEEMQVQLPGLAGGGHKPRLPNSALRFCKASKGGYVEVHSPLS